jgi:hypothetical protein
MEPNEMERNCANTLRRQIDVATLPGTRWQPHTATAVCHEIRVAVLQRRKEICCSSILLRRRVQKEEKGKADLSGDSADRATTMVRPRRYSSPEQTASSSALLLPCSCHPVRPRGGRRSTPTSVTTPAAPPQHLCPAKIQPTRTSAAIPCRP